MRLAQNWKCGEHKINIWKIYPDRKVLNYKVKSLLRALNWISILHRRFLNSTSITKSFTQNISITMFFAWNK
jgi:hypothetical protein